MRQVINLRYREQRMGSKKKRIPPLQDKGVVRCTLSFRWRGREEEEKRQRGREAPEDWSFAIQSSLVTSSGQKYEEQFESDCNWKHQAAKAYCNMTKGENKLK